VDINDNMSHPILEGRGSRPDPHRDQRPCYAIYSIC